MADTNALVKFQDTAEFNPADIAERFKVALKWEWRCSKRQSETNNETGPVR